MVSIATARQFLAHLGVSVADLRGAERPPVPTLARYLPRVMAATGPGARCTYGTYWNRMAALWDDRPLDAVAATDIEVLQREAATTALWRCNGRGGRYAGEHVIAAARALYSRAIADEIVGV